MQDAGSPGSQMEPGTAAGEAGSVETQEPQTPAEAAQAQEERVPSESAPNDEGNLVPANEAASPQEEAPQKEEITEMTEMDGNKKTRFLLDDGAEIIVRLNDNPAADALYEMLPLELTFEDFNGTEKIAYPPDSLPVDGSPDSCDPEVGSLCYYIPWGNLCFFYQDFRASSSLIPLGSVESGAEFLTQLDLAASVAADTADD